MDLVEVLQQALTLWDETILSLAISPRILEFESRVALLCFHCARYNNCWTCPPRIPNLDYPKIITTEYKNALLVYCQMPVPPEDFEEVRFRSTEKVHKALLHLEQVLREHNKPMVVSFIGGSCKLCKKGCAADRCRNPYLARIPIEATGVNLVKSLHKVGVDIKFPVTDILKRYGLLLW